MANITVTSLYEQANRTFKNGGIERFASDFIVAVNSTTAEINRTANLETRIARIDTREETLTLSDDYWDIVFSGICAQLITLGQRAQGDKEDYVAKAHERFLDGIESLYFDLINQRQDGDPDDESEDIIGLGHLG